MERKKRLKHNYKSGEVFHIFFHRPEGLTYANKNTNQWWEDNICYSYSSELAYADFENKVIYLRCGYGSRSTRRHENNLWHSIPPDWFKINIDWWNWERTKYSEPHETNLNKELIATLLKLKNNRGSLYRGIKYFGNPELVKSTIKQVEEILNKAKQSDKFPEWKKEAEKCYWSDEEIELFKIKNWALKNEFIGATKKKIKYYNDPILKKLVEDKFIANQSEKQLRELKRKEEAAKLEQEKLEKWLKGEYHGNLYNVPVHLRIVSNVTVTPNYLDVQTSLGARVPLKHAEILFKKFKQCIDTNTEWHTNGHSILVGLYKVQDIQQRLRYDTHSLDKEINIENKKYDSHLEWSILIGCHLIFATEIFKFVNDNKLDWYERE